MTVALVAIAIGYFSLWGIHHLHRQTARLCLQHQSLPTVSDEHRRGHGDCRFARRARRRARHEALARTVRGLLRRWTPAKALPGKATLGVGGGPLNVPEGEASMREGVVHLGEVADWMDDAVAAERGMARAGPPSPPPPPPPPTARMPKHPGRSTVVTPGCTDDGDDLLPSYDSVTEPQSLVANGFRYIPGSSTGTPAQGEGGGGSENMGK